MRDDALKDLVLSLPEAEIVGTPGAESFRVAGRTFASLPSPTMLILRLSQAQQDMVAHSDPQIYSALAGEAGAKGWTSAKVLEMDEASALSGLIMAWGNVAPAHLSKNPMQIPGNRLF